MTRAPEIVARLSAAIGFAETVTQRPPTVDRIPRLAHLVTDIDEAASWPIEGGNPIGPESAMLIEVLMHIEKDRSAGDGERVAKWLAIAHGLLELVRNNLAAALALTQTFSTSEGAGGGRTR